MSLDECPSRDCLLFQRETRLSLSACSESAIVGEKSRLRSLTVSQNRAGIVVGEIAWLLQLRFGHLKTPAVKLYTSARSGV